MAMIRMEQIRGLDAIPTTKLKGGYQVVETKALLDRIPGKNKQEGMKVYCQEDHTMYVLVTAEDKSLQFVAEDASEKEIRLLFGDEKEYSHTTDPSSTPSKPGAKVVASEVAWEDVTNKPALFPPAYHNHDDRYIKQSDALAIKTPYDIAVDNGFQGTEKEWIESLKGRDGKQPKIKIGNVTVGEDASVINVGSETEAIFDFTIPKAHNGIDGRDGLSVYEIAVRNGYKGTEKDWIKEYGTKPENGKSAYEIAIKNGFLGSEEAWIKSLHGKDGAPGKDGLNGRNGEDGEDGKQGKPGKSAYEVAVDNGFKGTEKEWLDRIATTESLKKAEDDSNAKIKALEDEIKALKESQKNLQAKLNEANDAINALLTA